MFELGHTSLRDDNFLGRFDGQIERKSAAKPHGNILHSLARYDKLAVGAEELILGQSGLQHLQCAVNGVVLTLVCVGCNLFV